MPEIPQMRQIKNLDDREVWDWPVTCTIADLELIDHEVLVRHTPATGWRVGVVVLDPTNDRWYAKSFADLMPEQTVVDAAATGPRSITKLARGRIKEFDVQPGDLVGLYLAGHRERSEIAWARWGERTKTEGGGPVPTEIPALSEITLLHAPDVFDWPATSQVTDASTTGDICVFHTMAGKWPTFQDEPEFPVGEGNPWVIAEVNGRWFAATYEWLRVGQQCKGVTQDNWGPHTKKAPLDSWRPQRGELIGLFMSTRARDRGRTSNERTDVVWVKYLEDGIVAREGEAQADPPGSPVNPDASLKALAGDFASSLVRDWQAAGHVSPGREDQIIGELSDGLIRFAAELSNRSD